MLITDDYIHQLKELHNSERGLGGKGLKWADRVMEIMKEYKIRELLDYGCGQGTLKQELLKRDYRLRIHEYDPAIPGKDISSDQIFPMVVCTDVLEHVEPDCIDHVLDHLMFQAKKVVFLVIALKESNKDLPDGRNAHLIIQPSDWWLEKLRKYGKVQVTDMSKKDLVLTVTKKG